MKPRCLAISLAILALATIAPGASAQQPKPGGQIVHGSAQEPDRIWGPVTGLTVSAEISQLVNASLIEINDKLEYAPSLAIEVPTLDNGGISKDGLRYAFKLRPGVKWHDGAPFTSGDVAFTQTVLLNPDVDVRGRVGWNKIARVETPDDSTVIFQFSAIDAPFLDRVAALGILPRHILGKLSSEPKSRRTSGFARPSARGRSCSRSGCPAATSCSRRTRATGSRASPTSTGSSTRSCPTPTRS